MRVIIEPDAEAVAGAAAARVAEVIRGSPACVLGLPTGATPLAFYAELVRRHREDGLSFSRVVAFGLDDYIGLPSGHRASFAAYMRRNLVDHVDMDPSNIHLLDSNADDLLAACASYEAAIRDVGGIDLQILGIGSNGHIGFNEPGSSLGSRTRIKTLTRETLEANAASLKDLDRVPHLAITMGVGTILEARACVLLALGSGKARAVRDMVEGPITAQVPASALQLHRDAIAILDEDAAFKLLRRDYYREVEEAQRRFVRAG